MRPDDVGEVRCEEWIVCGGQPRGQDGAAILRASDLRYRATKKLWRHGTATDRVFHIAAAPIEHDHFPRIFRVFAADLREEGRERVVVIHRPSVERMVVALGTLNAHPHEHLRDILGDLQCVALDLVEIR